MMCISIKATTYITIPLSEQRGVLSQVGGILRRLVDRLVGCKLNIISTNRLY